VEHFNGKTINDLRRAIKADSPVEVKCGHSMLKLQLNLTDEVLDEALFHTHGNFYTLIEHYQINETNPIKVTLPSMLNIFYLFLFSL